MWTEVATSSPVLCRGACTPSAPQPPPARSPRRYRLPARTPRSLDSGRDNVLSLRRAGGKAVPLLPCLRRQPRGGGPIAERRKVVTVIFADVVGSTALGE